MAGSVHTEAYRRLLQRLIEARGAAGLSQARLAQRLGKPPSFVGKYELGERRLDVLELAVVLRALGEDLPAFWTALDLELPDQL